MENLLNKAPVDLREEDFKGVNQMDDWRKFVPEQIKANWINLTERERKIIYMICVNKL